MGGEPRIAQPAPGVAANWDGRARHALVGALAVVALALAAAGSAGAASPATRQYENPLTTEQTQPSPAPANPQTTEQTPASPTPARRQYENPLTTEQTPASSSAVPPSGEVDESLSFTAGLALAAVLIVGAAIVVTGFLVRRAGRRAQD